jgi:hypothetical protein
LGLTYLCYSPFPPFWNGNIYSVLLCLGSV